MSENRVFALNSCSPSSPEPWSSVHSSTTQIQDASSPGDNLSLHGVSLAAEEGTQREANQSQATVIASSISIWNSWRAAASLITGVKPTRVHGQGLAWRRCSPLCLLPPASQCSPESSESRWWGTLLCQSWSSSLFLLWSHWRPWYQACQRDCLAALLGPGQFIATSEREDGEFLLGTAWKTRAYSFSCPLCSWPCNPAASPARA